MNLRLNHRSPSRGTAVVPALRREATTWSFYIPLRGAGILACQGGVRRKSTLFDAKRRRPSSSYTDNVGLQRSRRGSRAPVLLAACLALVVAPSLLQAKSDRRPGDLASPVTTQLIHQQNIAARASRGLPPPRTVSLEVAPEPVDELFVDDIGDIAIVDDGDGVFLPPLPFDLNGQTLSFVPVDPEASAYRYEVRDGGFDAQAAATGEFVVLGDDDSLPLDLDFAFPFFSEAYTGLFLNSDGNLTFGQGDNASGVRDPARAVTGPPRIMGLFADLDPTIDGSAIRVLSSAERFVATWINVPEFSFDATGLPQNFQVSLFANGRIEFSYTDVSTGEAIIGIAPGARFNESLAGDFSEPSTNTFSAAVVEIFLTAVVDLAILGQKFYLGHEDAYDFIVIFQNYEIPIDTGAFAFYLPIRNFVQGIGPFPFFAEAQNVTDVGSLLGSFQRLQGLMYMGELDQYPEDPNGRISRNFGLGLSTPQTVLTHEAGHRFLARTLFVDAETNTPSAEMLGRQFSHWSYYFNSKASLLEGNRIVDHGSGAFRFETTETIAGFSELDLYLMGLLPPEEVPPNFFVRNPSIFDNLFNESHEPLAGIFFDGERVEVTIDDIIAAHGTRAPDHTVSQRSFRYGFILLKQEGEEVPPEDIEKIEGFRVAFDEYFDQAVGNRAQIETKLVRKLGLTTWPAAGVLEGRTTEGVVFLENRTLEPVEVQFSSDSDLIQVPPSATIPAGAQFIEFPITGVSAGAASLTASSGDEFEVSHSRIRVLADRTSLSSQRIFPLEILLGDPRERLRTGRVGAPMPFSFFFQVFDENFLIYEDVRFNVSVTGDGRVDLPNPISDAFGFITVNWTLASTPGPNQMTVQIEGSTRLPLVIEAVGVLAPPRHRNVRKLLFGP